MITPQRERDLAMQVTRFLDDAGEFPSELTVEEQEYVARLISVTEVLHEDLAMVSENDAMLNPATSTAIRQAVRELEKIPETSPQSTRPLLPADDDAAAMHSSEAETGDLETSKDLGQTDIEPA
jgi:hypothetical protein